MSAAHATPEIGEDRHPTDAGARSERDHERSRRGVLVGYTRRPEMEPRDSRPERDSQPFTGADQAWLSVGLFFLLCLLAMALSEVLDRVSVGSEPYHVSWLAHALDLSLPWLQDAGAWLVVTGLAGWCLGLVIRASWPRLRATLLFGGVVAAVLGLVSFTDAACLGGYRAYDGTCAWE